MILPKTISRSIYRNKKAFSRSYAKEIHPFTKTWNLLSREMPVLLGINKGDIVYPRHADVVIIGGGYIGSSVAYWLKTRATHGLSVVVIEKDLTYKEAQRNISLGALTQHFSLTENMLLSQYGAEFLRNIKEHLNSDVDIQYSPTGSLVLASEKYAEKLEQNVTMLKEHGVRNELLRTSEISERFPWLNTDDIKLGCIGFESEGTFNSWALLKGLIQKSHELGATYVNAEVTGFELEQQRDVLMEGIPPGSFQRINKVTYKTSDNEEHSVKFAVCVLAAGDKSGQIAKLAKVGTGDGILAIPLPIDKREFKVYSMEDKAKETGLNTPLVMDTSGLWLRRNGMENNILFGQEPLLTVDYKESQVDEYYRNIIQPSLHNRVPCSVNAKINSLHTETFDCNTFDDTGILGPHPYHNNLYIAAGFGKHGCQHAPALGRAITELIIDSQFTTIDVTRLGFDRMLTAQPLVEFNIY